MDTNDFARKQPADRQRVRPSNAEPFLLTVYGDLEWGRYERKRTNGSDPVGIGIQPYRTDGASREIMNYLAPFLDEASQGGGQLAVVGGLRPRSESALDLFLFFQFTFFL